MRDDREDGPAYRLGLASPQGALVAELETTGPGGPEAVRAWVDGETVRWRGGLGLPDGIPLRALRRVLVVAEDAAGGLALTLSARYAAGSGRKVPAREVVLRDQHRRSPGEAAAFARVLRDALRAHPRAEFEHAAPATA